MSNTGRSRLFSNLLVMPRAISIDRQLRYATLPALCAAAAGFVLTWLLLIPPAYSPPQPVAVLRVRQSAGGSSELAMDEAVARLLSSESLARALVEAGVLHRIEPTVASQMAETVRESVRVDLRTPDEAGVQEVRIRWVGGPGEKFAGRLVKSLSRQLAAELAPRELAASATAEPRRGYEAARAELTAAEKALAEARAQFEASLEERTASSVPQPRREELAPDPPAKVDLAEAEEIQLTRQRLTELEQRRQLLGERLMPEHPDMKALDEKIEELRYAIARRPQPTAQRRPPVVSLPMDRQPDPELDDARIARSKQLWQAVLDAQNRYVVAIGREREYRRAPAVSRGQFVAEIESTQAAFPPVEQAAWHRWLLSGLTALLCGGLVVAVWPVRRQTFANAEEVRAVTRLPVVVLESASLN